MAQTWKKHQADGGITLLSATLPPPTFLLSLNEGKGEPCSHHYWLLSKAKSVQKDTAERCSTAAAAPPAWTHAERRQISQAAIGLCPRLLCGPGLTLTFNRDTCFPWIFARPFQLPLSLRHEWFMLLAFLHRPRWGVENWICPNSHTCTYSRTHAKSNS